MLGLMILCFKYYLAVPKTQKNYTNVYCYEFKNSKLKKGFKSMYLSKPLFKLELLLQVFYVGTYLVLQSGYN